MEAVIAAAARTGTMLEINANPDRRDLSELHARAAADAGVMLLINTDSHRITGFRVARYGIATARRAWLGAPQIANARSWSELQTLRKRAWAGHG
jgi:DNA polymerase (family 10)